MKKCMMFVLIFGMLIGTAGCVSVNTDTTTADLEAKVAELEAENAELKAAEEQMAEETEEQAAVEDASSGEELGAYINALYGDKKKMKNPEDYAGVAYYLDDTQSTKYYILRDIDNDGVEELYISDSQTSDTSWWCILDYVNEEVVIPQTYLSDSTVQKSALLKNNMIYKYAHSGLVFNEVYPGSYTADECTGENCSYSICSLDSNGGMKKEMELFWQSGVEKNDMPMPDLYYKQGEAVPFDEWEVLVNQYIVSQEMKAEEYMVLSEENLRPESMSEEVESQNYDIESEIQNIRDIYYTTQENIGSYRVADMGPGDLLMGYYDLDGNLCKLSARKGLYDEYTLGGTDDTKALPYYSAEYYYDCSNGAVPILVFVFVYDEDEEYRYYVRDGKCIRYIDNDGTLTDYPEGANCGTIAYTDCFIRTGMAEIHWGNPSPQE